MRRVIVLIAGLGVAAIATALLRRRKATAGADGTPPEEVEPKPWESLNSERRWQEPRLSPQRRIRVVLSDVGPNKIAVVREVRAATGLSLKNVTNLVENPPSVLGTSRTGDTARRLKDLLEATGATVELR